MEWGSSVTTEYLQRSAIKRAELLAAQNLADPATNGDDSDDRGHT
jgi:hypothetical protein